MFHVTDWLPTLMDAVSPRWSKTNKALDLVCKALYDSYTDMDTIFSFVS